MNNSIEILTELQAELGYKQGELSTVAMLGLVGEAGEVIGECHGFQEGGGQDIEDVIIKCRVIEDLKKKVRKGEDKTILSVWNNHKDNFDAELADVFYYVNILATNRGLTIFDLAQMAHDKVRAKQAAGGSSEDPNTITNGIPAEPMQMQCEHEGCNSNQGSDYIRKTTEKGWEDEPIFLCDKHSNGYTKIT